MPNDGTQDRIHVEQASGATVCGLPNHVPGRRTAFWRYANCVECRFQAAPAHLPRIYIAGPLSSDPSRTFEEKAAVFEHGARDLDEHGYVAVPATYVDPDCGLTPDECVATQVHKMVSQGQGKHSWECYLKSDLRAMLRCSGVALLPAWSESPGARLEFNTAIGVGIHCMDIGAWIKARPSILEAAQ